MIFIQLTCDICHIILGPTPGSTALLINHPQFADAARLTYQTADELYGNGSLKQNAVRIIHSSQPQRDTSPMTTGHYLRYSYI